MHCEEPGRARHKNATAAMSGMLRRSGATPTANTKACAKHDRRAPLLRVARDDEGGRLIVISGDGTCREFHREIPQTVEAKRVEGAGMKGSSDEGVAGSRNEGVEGPRGKPG
jgi:hypothetical protein